LIGVCFAADYEGNEGLYAALDSIHDELTEQGLGEISGSAAAHPGNLAAGNSTASPAVVRGQEPLAPVQPVPDRGFATPAAATVAVDPAASAANGPPQGLSAAEQAAWEEIMTRAASAEVICIIRPKEPGGQSEVITLDDVSPEFVRSLMASRRDQQGGMLR
jgi:hypothetical protein